MAIGICSSAMVPRTAGAFVLEGIGVSVLMDQFFGSLDGTIKKAQDAGDFVLWRAAIQVRDALDAWKRTNGELLDKAFDELDDAESKFVRDVNALLDQGTLQVGIALDRAEEINLAFTQTVSTTIFASGDPWIMSYTPRVVTPVGEDNFLLVVSGPNLANANARLEIEPPVDMIGPKAMEIAATMARANLPFEERTSKFVTLPLTYLSVATVWYKPWTWFSSERGKSDLTFWLLPTVPASYQITTKIRVDAPETKIEVLNLGTFRGRNSEIDRAVPIPAYEQGWRLDLYRRGEIRLHDRGGDRGRCEGIRQPSITANGLTMYARVDNRDSIRGRRDAFVNCAISLPLIKAGTADVDGPSKPDPAGAELGWADLAWNKDETFELPQNLVGLRIIVRTFDGNERTYTGAAAEKFLRISQSDNLLTLRAQAPKEF
ncbi:MAG: hypothetical protein E5Y58_05330 [Mesorhizobium sp.]|nr:MAG: hypothetical protein E5Y58_05330 [Mesorhizobium sp.]